MSRYATSERQDAEHYGMHFVIAGRMVRLLTGIRADITVNDFYDVNVFMKLWSVRNHIVEQFRRQPMRVNFEPRRTVSAAADVLLKRDHHR